MTDTFAPESFQQKYTSSLIIVSLLIIVVHPAFHFVLTVIPGVPPERLALRLIPAAVSVALLLAVWLSKPIRRFSPWLQVVNSATVLIATHLLVIDSGNHPLYLSASLTAIYGAQLSFLRLTEWIMTATIVFVSYLIASLAEGTFVTTNGLMPLLFYASNYIIATALVTVRDRLQRRELSSRRELEQKNVQLSHLTDTLQSELVLAREIQQSLLPPPTPAWPYLDVACYSQPAREVGGDFYSYHTFSNGCVGLAVGDVSGKGVSAALLMATSISLFNASMNRAVQPSSLLASLDTELAPYTMARNQNCALCYVDLLGSTLRIANAGGIPPYIRRADGSIEWPDVWGFALGQGLGAEAGYQTVTTSIAPGDLIVLVSDGVVEGKNNLNELFGFERLERTIAAGPQVNAQAMVDYILSELNSFVGNTEPHDDATIAVICIRKHDIVHIKM